MALMRDILALPPPIRERMLRLATAWVSAPACVRADGTELVEALARAGSAGVWAMIDEIDRTIAYFERSRIEVAAN